MTINEREENAYTLAVQAGLWGYPLAHRVEAFPRTLEAKGAGRNSFRKFDRLKSAEDRFVVTPNNLTIDGYALLDLADGPVVIDVPKLADERWFIVQIGDAFDDVVLNVGGSRPHVPGAYLITGPEFQGRLPGDMIQVSFRTNIGFVALRIAVNSADDLAGALQAQEGFTIRPLPDYLRDGITRAEPDYSPIPFPALTAPKELDPLRPPGGSDEVHAAHPRRRQRHLRPDARHHRTQRPQGLRLAGTGQVHAGRVAPRRTRGRADRRRAVENHQRDGQRLARFAGLGSLQFRLGTERRQHQNQVGTEVADQVVYVNTAVDVDDQTLDGANDYVVYFEPGQTPPVAGMWNIAMYDDSMLFVANEIDRVSIGSTTDGLTPNPDGSLTIYLQHTKPEGDRASNWLPAPAGTFNLTMRYYTPLAPVLTRDYKLPAVRKA